MDHALKILDNHAGPKTVLAVWSNLSATNSVGESLSQVAHGHLEVQVGGALEGATVVLEGTIDGLEYRTLRTPAGKMIVISGEGDIAIIAGRPLNIRPRLIDASDATDVNVCILGRTL